jgi:tetratricopeptide (TPR) repeat protein
MSQGWHLAGHWYVPGLELGTGVGGRSWQILQDEGDGSRWVLQRWCPRLSDRELDQVRELYLQRFTGAEPLDLSSGRFGFDDGHVWFLQKLPGNSLAEVWGQWSQILRDAFLDWIQKALARDLHPRLLHPEAISLRSGQIFVPRVIGEAPWDWKGFESLLDGPPGELPGPAPWEAMPDLADRGALPIRGRGQELTYLKSLMMGLATPAPMERIVVLQGEEGMGLGRLGEWAAAAAETEAIWVRCFEVQPEEKAGAFLGRMLQSLLKGVEADLYARTPETARTLARRLSTFAFLRGGLRPVPDAPLEPGEVTAALRILEFLAGIHPRMLQIRHVERADGELQAVLGELAIRSNLAWFFSISLSGPGNQTKGLLGPLRNHPYIAFVYLNRLEDHDLLDLLDDLLQPNALGPEFRGAVCQASLGNPGLLQSILETAQLEGTLLWERGRGWALAPGQPLSIKPHEDMVGKVLAGRMHRLGSAPGAVIRLLSLADQPLSFSVLGSALGIAGDPLEEALRMAITSKLILAKDGWARLASPRVQDLALEGMPEAEIRRMARALLKALRESGSAVLSVHLESLAADERSALERVLLSIDQGAAPSASEAEDVVRQALRLHPTPLQESRLWEFLSDAWSRATHLEQIPASDTPFGSALEALGKASTALSRVEEASSEELAGHQARFYRKEAFLRIQLRDVVGAHRAIQSAAECLADHPHHAEQPLLRLALGRLHIHQGFIGKGIKALEEGLHLMSPDGVLPSHQDQVGLLLELGRAQGQRCQFQRALATLQSTQRLMEHDQDYRRLTGVLLALSQVYLALGQSDVAYGHLREALQTARMQNDAELMGWCHLHIGIFRSCQQALASALSHLDAALERFQDLRDRMAITLAKAWKARTLAALGDTAQCDMVLLQALDIPRDHLSAQEWGDLLFLQAEIIAFRGGWRDAARLYLEAVHCHEGSGLIWGERLARLRYIQALAHTALASRSLESLDQAWSLLERHKAVVEGSGSRWLDLEWHRAHALLLSTLPDTTETVAMDSLTALGGMLSAGRDMRFPAHVLEASALSAVALLRRGETLGARSRLQDAFSCLQEVWSRVPESMELSFLGRPDIHHFKEVVEAAGMTFVLPERVDPLVDWTPSHITLPALKLF